MAASNRRDLYLQVSGNVDQLGSAMKAGKSALLSLGSAAIDVQGEIDKALANLGANAPAQAKQLERSYTQTFNTIRQNARSVLEAPNAGAALQVLDAGAAEQSARAAENQAAALRQVATAAATVATKAGEAGAAERVLAVAAAASATEAERDAIALRSQANVLGAVRDELQSVGVAQQRGVVVNGQARAGYQQLSYQLGDVATQYAAGTSATIIFAQQSGQVVQAISLIAGEAKGFIGLLGGPWGIGLSSALVLLSPFVGKILEGGDALAKETNHLKENADKTAIADRAKQAFVLTEAGAIEDVRALTNELKKQNDELKTNAERMNIRAKSRLSTLSDRRTDVADELEQRRGELRGLSSAPAATDASLNDARASTRAAISQLEATLARVDRAVAQADAARLETQRDLAAEAAKRANDPIAQITRKYEGPDGLIEQAKKRASAEEVVNGTLTRQLTILGKQQKVDAAAAQKRLAAARATGNDNQIGREVNVAEATRIAASIGGVVTSGQRSTERQAQLYADKLAGRHAGPVAKPGTSDHERGQAIDIAYGPGVSAGSIRKAFAKEGVAIRQLLDERDQKVFHVGFGPKGKSQESVTRAAEAAEQKRIRDDEAYTQLKGRAEQELLDAKRGQVMSVSAAAKLDEDALRLEQSRRDSTAQAGVTEKRWSQAKADELKALNKTVADVRVAGVDERKRVQFAADALQLQRDDLQGQNDLLSLQADLATSATDRRRIGLEILANEEKLASATLQAAINAEADPTKKAGLERQLGRVAPEFDMRRTKAEEQTDDPLQSYGRGLIKATANMDEAFKGVKADGLASLEDGLVGVIQGTESVAGAFKKMAADIIADLARIAVQKLILKAVGTSFFGFAEGGEVQANAAGGQIFGAGTGTSDDILSWLSNGEFVVTAAATKRHLPLLKAINDNQLPAFATGGVVGGAPLPGLPNLRQAANDLQAGRPSGGGMIMVRVALSDDLHATIDNRAAGVAVQVMRAAAPSIVDAATTNTVSRLRQPSL
ncbi:MAG TPA: D-alanyl-D-alanine carboxypeptidase family protein [Sphingomonas sp.]|jgi:hypothetical protein